MCLIIKRENFTFIFSLLFIVSIVVVSVCYLMPRQVNQLGWLITNNSNFTNANATKLILYQVSTNELGKMTSVKWFLFCLNTLRGPILLIFLFVLNVIIGFKYNRHLKKKQHLRFSNIKSMNIFES